jgi:hypothetical protein
MKTLAIGLMAILALSGCVKNHDSNNPQTADDTNNLLYTNINVLARYGLRTLLDNNEDKIDEIKEKMTKVHGVLSEHVLPLFDGRELNMSTIFGMLASKSDKIDPLVADVLELVFANFQSSVRLPSNPLDMLDAETKELVKTAFVAMKDALEKAIVYTPSK